MAVKTKPTMLIDLVKNKNTASKTYGLYYGRIFKRQGINLKGLARHMTEHGSLAGYDVVVLVLQNMAQCIREHMIQGIPVKLDGLGTFSPSITSSGVAALEDYSPNANIHGVRMVFRPEASGEAEEKLTPAALKAATSFKLNDYIEITTKTINGKVKRYHERTPLAHLGIINAQEDPEEPEGDDEP